MVSSDSLSILKVLADQSPGCEWFTASRRVCWGKRESHCHREELIDRVACQSDDGKVGFIQITDGELLMFPLAFCGRIL